MDEKFGLVSQMRRSAYSVPMNIADGNSKRSNKEQAHFFEIAICSIEELHYQCFLAAELEYMSIDVLKDIDDRIQRTGFLIGKLRKSLI